MAHEEKLKEYSDIEGELERVNKIVQEKDVALKKYVAQNDQL